MRFTDILNTAKRWFSNTPDRALDQAYKAALMVKAIEDEHFNGQKVSTESAKYSDTVITYFQEKVEKYLNTAKLRLTEFKTSNSFFKISNYETRFVNDDNKYYTEIIEKPSIIIEKLDFIDEIISKYQVTSGKTKDNSLALIKIEKNLSNNASKFIAKRETNLSKNKKYADKINDLSLSTDINNNQLENVSDKTGVLPRSILRTFSRIKQEIDPKSNEAEEAVISKFRKSRNKTAISVKFLLMLVIIPLLTHQLAKIAITPFVEQHFFRENSETIFLNRDLEQEALHELSTFEENLRLKSFLGIVPEISPKKNNELKKQKAAEIVDKFRHRSQDAIENVLADIFSFLAFVWVIIVSKKEILVLKSFIDEIIYGLSDSAKAFLIILFTDIFVGYHSPHGWEIILEGIAKHFGFPESREFNFLFIATFPVILDTVLKYWIFRYLNRISPSAVATYRNMNE